jgi:hypothetical protein
LKKLKYAFAKFSSSEKNRMAEDEFVCPFCGRIDYLRKIHEAHVRAHRAELSLLKREFVDLVERVVMGDEGDPDLISFVVRFALSGEVDHGLMRKPRLHRFATLLTSWKYFVLSEIAPYRQALASLSPETRRKLFPEIFA